MILQLVLSVSAPLMTAVLALVWACLVAGGMNRLPERETVERRDDIRTW